MPTNRWQYNKTHHSWKCLHSVTWKVWEGVCMCTFYSVRMCSRVTCLVASVCVCMCVCVAKKLPVWAHTTWKSPISVNYCSLVKLDKRCCIMVSHVLSNSAMNANECRMLMVERQHATAVKADLLQYCCRYSVLTVLSAHRVCVLWNSSWLHVEVLTSVLCSL